MITEYKMRHYLNTWEDGRQSEKEGKIKLKSKPKTFKNKSPLHERVPFQDAGWDHIVLFDMQAVERVQTMVDLQEKAQQSRT